ncbi:TolC family protein [Roseococcus sp. DSY-14]|uniref:TolC family protein n=1 Tax=Roseococcus sp. DSY-14 TaxID=3369650 RepID=UPI00387AA71A
MAPLAVPAPRAEQPAPRPRTRAPQPPAPANGLTLAEAEARLVERNLAVIAAQRGVDAARAQRLVASSLPPPSVSVGNTFGQYNEGPNTGTRDIRGLSPSNNINAGLTVLVELGGKRTLRTRLAEGNIGVAEAQVLDTLRQQIFALRQAFIAALAARANYEVAASNRQSLDRTEALLRRQLQDGALPEGDLLRFQAARLPFEAEVTTAAQNYAAAAAQLAVALAADAAALPAPRPGLPAVALEPRGTLPQRADPGVSRGELLDAVRNRPDVVAAQRQAAAATTNTELAQASQWRDVTANAGWGRTRLSQNLPSGARELDANNQFTFNLSVPIFTNRIVQGNIGVAQGQQAQAEALARAALLQARADFATAWSALEQARALSRLFSEGGALNRAELAYRSTEQAYLAGGRSLLEVLDALRTLNATRVAANNARAGVLLALAQLEAATGVGGLMPR